VGSPENHEGTEFACFTSLASLCAIFFCFVCFEIVSELSSTISRNVMLIKYTAEALGEILRGLSACESDQVVSCGGNIAASNFSEPSYVLRLSIDKLTL
jgi:hypothetical protein